ncbi:MAG TPA: M1 family aminopeptidase [Gemmatimonadales bacterium]|nr:M1 family aminopeptidase [Gemmatimonadales bacterium]
MRLPAFLVLAAAVLVHPRPLAAQDGAAEAFAPPLRELFAMQPVEDRGASVSGLVIERDDARFELTEGVLHLLSPVRGRTVGAAFRGRGTFHFRTPLAVERWRIRRHFNADTVAATFTEAVFLFTDSTLAELERGTRFGPGAGGDLGALRDRVEQALDWLGDEEAASFDEDFLDGLLNGTSPGTFHAYVRRATGDPVVYVLDPSDDEGVSLLGRVNVGVVTGVTEKLVAHPRGGVMPAPDPASGRLPRRQAVIEHYDLDVGLPRNATGEVRFSAGARLRLLADDTIGPWVAFHLFPRLEVDSARGPGGEPVPVHKGKDDPALWLRLDRPLARGEAREVTVYYHGDLIDRYGDFFFINSGSAWYPRTLEGRTRATFDITYHTPASFAFVSVGELADSTVTDGVLTTRWRARAPIRNAAFNLGLFEAYTPVPRKPDDPPVTVLWAEDAHRKLPFVRERNMKERVGDDVQQSLAFFAHGFGPPPVEKFYATEIPYGHGEAFPGLVHLSWSTFQAQQRDGTDQWFRAHEVAHQWWGIAVDFATYRDQWMSEGFASFAGLWYLQNLEGGRKRYFEHLARYRDGLFTRGDALGPIWLGYRVASGRDQEDYARAVYEKGAWVLHMLRVMLLDLKAMKEDRFTAMMQDFYASYRGRRASTADFQRVVERHVGQPMGWFFDQWVMDNRLPTWRVAHRSDPEGEGFRVRLRVEQDGVPETFRAYVPVTVRLEDGREARFRVQVTGARSEISLPLLLPAKPREVVFNDLEGVLARVERGKWE